jgi:hypothetical protein
MHNMTDSTKWLNDNAGGDNNPGVYFGAIGQKIVGTIVGTPRQVVTQYGDRLVIDLVVAEGSTALKGNLGEDGPVDTGETVSLWVKPGAMATALRQAVNEADAKGLTEGDTLAVKFVEEQDTGKPSKLKVYKAQYHGVKPAVSVDDLIPAEEPF